MKTFKRKGGLLLSGTKIQHRVCIAIPMTGLLRAEWVHARYGQTIPVNWSNADFVQYFDTFSPMSFSVADARNLSVAFALTEGFEWLVFIDHDVVLPPDTFIKLNTYMSEGKTPVVSGLYNAKGYPPEPLVFRGRGNSVFRKWKPGDKIWVDAIPMGCALIHTNLLRVMWNESEQYVVRGNPVRRVFDTPRATIYHPDTGRWIVTGGTEDIFWCDRIIKEGFLRKAGFPNIAKKKYPFLLDTSIKCGHIDNSGRIF